MSRPFGREAEDLVVKQLELGVFEKPLRIVARQRLDRLPQAPVGPAFADPGRVGARSPIFVNRMRGDAVFRDLVHFVGANLQLDALAARTDDGGVDRTVVVLLGRRDIVLEAPGHARPGRMRDADRGVAVGDGVDENPEAVDVGQLFEGDRPALHLLPDRIGLLLPALDLDLDAAAGELVGELRRDPRDDRAILGLHRLETRDDQRVGVRHQAAEGEVLELAAHALHAHAARERGIDVEGVLGDAGPLVLRHELERAHVVQAVGELHQQHPRVVGDRQQQLAEIFGLLRVPGDEVELA